MTLPTNLDYTDKDRTAIKRRLDSLIDSVFATWSEKARANFGNILLDLFAHVGGIHTFYIDQWARESRISVAQLRRSLLGLVKLIDYTPTGRSAATVDCTVTLAEALPADTTFQAGSTADTSSIAEPLQFQLLTDLVIPAGQLTGEVTLEHSETIEESVASDDTPNQTFRLGRTPFVLQSSSPTITFGDGSYERVDSLLDSTSTDRHYTVQVDANDRATVFFGNGVNGKIPFGTGTIVYKIGGGEAGNIEADDIGEFTTTFTDDNGNIASVTITNATDASGGGERASNAEIRQNAPKAARVLNRAIAREDYSIVATTTVSGLARALSITSEEDSAIGENQLYLFLVPEGGGTASTALIEEVQGKFEVVSGQPTPTHPTINTLDLRVQSAAYSSVDHSVRAYRTSSVTESEMKLAIEAVLADFYSVKISAARLIEIAPKVAAENNITSRDGTTLVQNPLVDFGFGYKNADGDPTGLLSWSDVFNVIRDLPEVRKVDASDGLLLNGIRDDANIGTFKFPIVGTITVIDGDTGNTI